MNLNFLKKIKPFLALGRYNYPTGGFLLMWPCFWGVFYQLNFETDFIKTLILFFVGSFVMRGAGCCINDYFDRDLDKKVSRTKSRPLACNALSARNAFYFILLQLLIGFAVVINLNAKAIFFSFLIIPVIIIYPLLKRVSNYPQLFLGIAFNWGVLVGFATQNDYFSSGIIFLFLGGVFLTIAYDTIYAFQDINDDKRIGIGSLAIILEKNSKKYILLIFFISYLFFTLSLVYLKHLSFVASLILSIPILVSFLFQYKLFVTRKSYKLAFDSNVYTGGLITSILLLSNYF